jgi:cobalt-zinc-cadmium efflux system outer membrane protein
MCIPHRRGVIAAVGSLLLLSSPAWADELPSPLHLRDLVAVLRRNNPEVAERRSLARAAETRPRAVSQLDDPMLSVEWWQQPINFSMVPLMVSVRQPLPWPGKLRARREVAEREVATSRDQIVEAERRLEAQAKMAFLDLALAERSLTINDRQRTLVEAMVQSAESKYRVGKAPQASILKTQEELLTVENERLDLDRARDEARARLNALLDRPPGAPLPAVALPLSTVRLPDEAELLRIALERRPDVRLAEDAVAQAQAWLGVARREANPELAVWAGYMVNIRGVDTFTAGVSTTLPFFSSRRRTSAVTGGEAELEAARHARDAARRRAEMEVRIAVLQMDAAMRHEKLHSAKLIPLSELSLQSAQAAYQNDRIDFFSVLDAARMVRTHHLDHERYLVEYQKRLAELELAVGQDFAAEETP